MVFVFKTQAIPEVDNGCVLARGISLETVPGITEQTILYIQPCASVQGRVNCELRLGIEGTGVSEEFFEFTILSKVLTTYGDRFAENRTSIALGAARIKWRGKKILIFRNGRIVIREALDENDVHATLEFLSKLLAPSIQCSHCRENLTDCAAGLCQSCSTHPFVMTEEPKSLLWKQARAKFEAFLGDASKFKSAVEDEIRNGVPLTSSPFETLENQSVRTSRLLLDFLVSSTERRDIASGLALLKICWDTESCMNTLNKMHVKSTAIAAMGGHIGDMFTQLLDFGFTNTKQLYAEMRKAPISARTTLEKKEVSEMLRRIRTRPELDALFTEVFDEESIKVLVRFGETP